MSGEAGRGGVPGERNGTETMRKVTPPFAARNLDSEYNADFVLGARNAVRTCLGVRKG